MRIVWNSATAYKQLPEPRSQRRASKELASPITVLPVGTCPMAAYIEQERCSARLAVQELYPDGRILSVNLGAKGCNVQVQVGKKVKKLLYTGGCVKKG